MVANSNSAKSGAPPACSSKSVEELAKARQEAIEKAEKAKEIHRLVVDTIVGLVSTVPEDALLEKLHCLDVGSWDEVVEERYLARCCGFPTCSVGIVVENYMGKKYWIQKRERKIYTAVPKSEKFCSRLCLERSNFVQQQLFEEPLWFNWDRPPRSYTVQFTAAERQPRSVDDILMAETDRLLVTRLNDLKIADHNDSGSGSEDEEEQTKKKAEDERFLTEIRSFVSSVGQQSRQKRANVASAGIPSATRPSPSAAPAPKVPSKVPDEEKRPTEEKKDEKPDPKPSSAKPDDKKKKPATEKVQADDKKTGKAARASKPASSAEQLTPEQEQKLARLREKFGRRPERALKKPPILIDAPALSPQLAARLPDDMR